MPSSAEDSISFCRSPSSLGAIGAAKLQRYSNGPDSCNFFGGGPEEFCIAMDTYLTIVQQLMSPEHGSNIDDTPMPSMQANSAVLQRILLMHAH